VSYLDLSGTAITDDSIQHRLKLPNLSHVYFYKTNVTVRGLAPLIKHPNGRFGLITAEIEQEKQSEALEPFVKDGHFLSLVIVDQHEPLPSWEGPPIE
jgi:hypothetical protein